MAECKSPHLPAPGGFVSVPIIRGSRIAVWGNSGSGKSTLARELGRRLQLPVLELDAVIHARPHWVDLSREEFRDRVVAFLDAHPDGWVIEGNYHGMVGDLIRPRTQTQVWLRLPFRLVYRRLAWRTVSRSISHTELWGGNRESLKQTFLTKDSMLVWGVREWKASLRRTEAAKAQSASGTQLITVRSSRAVRQLLDAIGSRPSTRP